MATPNIITRHTLYKLKRRFGTKISLYNRTGVATNFRTGEKTATLVKVNINKAIVLQARDFRMFSYDLAFISANKDFTMGGFYDPSDRRVIIDKADMSETWTVTSDQYVVYDNIQYKIVECTDYNNAIFLLIRALKGESVVRIEEAINILTLEQEVS